MVLNKAGRRRSTKQRVPFRPQEDPPEHRRSRLRISVAKTVLADPSEATALGHRPQFKFGRSLPKRSGSAPESGPRGVGRGGRSPTPRHPKALWSAQRNLGRSGRPGNDDCFRRNWRRRGSGLQCFQKGITYNLTHWIQNQLDSECFLRQSRAGTSSPYWEDQPTRALRMRSGVGYLTGRPRGLFGCARRFMLLSAIGNRHDSDEPVIQ